MKSHAIKPLALLIAVLFGITATAQEIHFDGDTANPGDWNDAANWTGDVLPSAANPLTDVGSAFGGGALSATANISGALTTDTIGELRLGRGDGATGVVNHSAGTLNTAGWTFIGVDGVGAQAQGTYNLSGTGNLTGGDAWFVGFGGGAGMSQGNMSFADQSSATFGAFVVGANDNNTGMVTQTGGSVQYNSWMTVGESGGATGTYDMSGGSLTQNADFLTIGERDGATGTFNVSGTATLALNAAGISVGRRTGGTGSLNIDGSAASITTTNLFMGIDTDDMSGSGDSTLSFTADAGGVTPIIALGSVFLNDGTLGSGSANLVLDLSAAPDGDILLIDVAGVLTGQFTGLAEGAFVGANRRITYQFGDGNDIGILAVPEPATASVLMAACIGLFVRRRRS